MFGNVLLEIPVTFLCYRMIQMPPIRPLFYRIVYSFGEEIQEHPSSQNMSCPSSLLQSLCNWSAVHLVADMEERYKNVKIHKPTISAITGKCALWVRMLIHALAKYHSYDVKETPDWECEWETLSCENARRRVYTLVVHLVIEIIHVRHGVFNHTFTLNRPFDSLISRQPRRRALWGLKFPCEYFTRLVVRASVIEASSSRADALDMIRRAMRRARRLGERIVKDDKRWVIIALPNAHVVRAGLVNL